MDRSRETGVAIYELPLSEVARNRVELVLKRGPQR